MASEASDSNQPQAAMVDDEEFKVPTAEEMSNLKATQQQFKSNFLRLQFEEILREVRVDYEGARCSALKEVLHTLKAKLDDIKPRKVSAGPAGTVLGVPFSGPGKAQCSEPVSITVEAPSAVDLVGSFLLETVAKPGMNVDVAVQLPLSMLHHKDHLNMRYLRKRALYLRALGAHLAKSAQFRNISVQGFCGDKLKPILVLQRAQDAPSSDKLTHIPKGYTIRLLPCLPDEAQCPIPPRKLVPSRNSVRGITDVSTGDAKVSTLPAEALPPTPYYNSLVLEDMYLRGHLRLLHSLIAGHSALKDAIMLLKLWSYKRGHSVETDTFNGFLFSMFVADLLRQQRLNTEMSSYQAFRVVMLALATSDMASKPYRMVTSGQAASLDDSEFRAAFEVCMVDPTGRLNLAFRVSKSAFEQLQVDARAAVCYLDPTSGQAVIDKVLGVSSTSAHSSFELDWAAKQQQGTPASSHSDTITGVPTSSTSSSLSALTEVEACRALFTTPSTGQWLLRYDNVVSVQLDAEAIRRVMGRKDVQCTRKTALSGTSKKYRVRRQPMLDPVRTVGRVLYSVLQRGLGDRARRLHVRAPPVWSRPFNQKKDFEHDPHPQVHIGLCIDPEHSLRVLDMGPPAEEKQRARAFRLLWGRKSELRRFKDGSINEAVAWDGYAAHQRHHIIPAMVTHLLNRHINSTEQQVCFLGPQLDSVLDYTHRSSVAELDQADAADDEEVMSNGKKRKRGKKATRRKKQKTGRDVVPHVQRLQLPAHPTENQPLLFAAFKRLSGALQSAKDVPLSIVSIQATHPAFRYVSPYPPIPLSSALRSRERSRFGPNVRLDLEPVGVVVQFESSSSWPDDPLAMERIKSAFYIRMGSAIPKALTKVRHTADEVAPHAIVAKTFVDVIVDGFAFRIRIFNERELLIRKAKMEDEKRAEFRAAHLEKLRASGALDTPAPRVGIALPVHLADELNMSTEQPIELPITADEVALRYGPLHCSSMRGFALSHPVFARATRLAWRWFSSHMFAGDHCIPWEAVELLTCFVCRGGSKNGLGNGLLPFDKPGSPFVVLVRLLHLVAHHDWAHTPIVVDINDTMSDEDYTTALQAFEAQRAAKSGANMFIATPYDLKSRVWTANGKPTKPALTRLVAYAKSALRHLETLCPADSRTGGPFPSSPLFASLFKTPLAHFDAWIELDVARLPPHYLQQSVFSAPLAKLPAAGSSTGTVSPKARVLASYSLQPEDAAASSSSSSSNASSQQQQPKGRNYVVGLNLAERYVAELRQKFGPWAHFFFDHMGGVVVGVQWKKDRFKQRKFKPSIAALSQPVALGSSLVEPNKPEILASMQRCGKDLVKAVHTSLEHLKK